MAQPFEHIQGRHRGGIRDQTSMVGWSLGILGKGDHVQGHLAVRQSIKGIVVQAGLPLFRQGCRVPVAVVLGDDGPDPCPDLRITEHRCGIHEQGIVHHGEICRQFHALSPERDFSGLPFVYQSHLPRTGTHEYGRPHQVWAGQ